MYGTIPDVVISKPPRNNQLRVVALASAFLIGALGTALLTPAPTPAPRPILAADPEMNHELIDCLNSLLDYCDVCGRTCCDSPLPASRR